MVNKSADLTIGAQGFSTFETSRVKCRVTVKNKTPFYRAVERGNTELTEFLANKLEGVKLLEFTAKIWTDAGSKDKDYTCVKLKKIAYSPSAWAQHPEN